MASVIAGYEPDWRSMMEMAGRRQYLYFTGDAVIVNEGHERTFCYAKETGTEAPNATRDIEALNVPPTLTDLMDETLGVLGALQEPALE